MLRFNWLNIIKVARGNCNIALKILEALFFSTQDRKILKLVAKLNKDFQHTLEEPLDFFMSQASNNEKCMYLSIKMRLNHATGERSIPIYFIDHIYSRDEIHANRLLRVDNERIYFDY